MCPLCMLFVVLHHIWVAPIYAVNFVAAVLFFVDTYVGLLTHILAWGYQLFVSGDPTLVGCRNKMFQSSPKQLGRTP